jgi:Flp pilus assembly protein TadD
MIFLINLLIGCYSKETFVGQNSTPNQRDHNRNISNKDLQSFLSSLKKIDGNLEAQYMQALYFQKKNKHKIAIALLNEVVQKDPTYANAYNAMGISYDYLGDYSSAINSYKLALKINPDLDYVHNNLGYSYLLNGNLDSAIDAFQKAIVLNENNKRYHNNLGLAYTQKGQIDLAIEQFTLAGDEISANHKLSQILYREGKHELARKYQHKAIQLENAINSNKSIVASNKKKYSDNNPKLKEKSLESIKSNSASEISQNSFEEKNKSVFKNIPHYNITKENRENIGEDPIRGQINDKKSIEEISKISDQYDKGKESLVRTDSNIKNKSLKSTIENQEIKNIQYLIEPEIEVSNGNGVNRMAARMGNYLRNKGLNISLLTNADHFGYKETKIYYSDPYLHDAYRVAQQIPGWQNMEKVNKFNQQRNKIKVLIGKDLIPYNRSFSENKKEVSFHPYSILLSSCRMRESVQKVLFKYHEIGLVPYIVKIELGEKKLWWRIFIGHYKYKEEALKVIKEYGLSEAIVMKTPYTNLIGNYSSEGEATEMLQSIKELGYSPYIIKPGENNYQIVVGAFKKRKQAEKQKIDLLSDNIKSRIIRR